MCSTQLCSQKIFLPHRFWDMGFWLGAPPTLGDKLLSNKWLVLADLILGNTSHYHKNFLPCHFWDTASDWECHVGRGINCCKINNWFWVIWPWGIHPRHFKNFLPCRFWDTAFDLERPLCQGMNFSFKKKNNWFSQFVWYWQVGGYHYPPAEAGG